MSSHSIDASGLDVLHITRDRNTTTTVFPNGQVIAKQHNMISAKIIKDSVNIDTNRITTFELEYPRFIHAELMTHRQFSRNAASSRAVPVANMIKHVELNPAEPVSWGQNQPGMRADTQLDDTQQALAQHTWRSASASACEWARLLSSQGVHKQIVNRVTEPFQIMKTIVTATEYLNWFWLRCHADAQPEIKQLADCMRLALQKSDAELLLPGDWHVPYVNTGFTGGIQTFSSTSGTKLSLADALKVSASCCAQVSYRREDDSLAKAQSIYDKLIVSEPAHASPVEHQATPMPDIAEWEWPTGVTHQDAAGDYWSANFCGWIQNRKLLGL